MKFTVFYSWQSDLPNPTNRNFIQTALEKAVKSIRDDDSITIEPVLDRDTQGVADSPDIADTIFDKIAQAQIFVCDVSIINSGNRTDNNEVPRPTPNPNVLIELGYAIKTLGWQRVIMVINTVYGNPEKLPFDLRIRRFTTYAVEQDAGKAEARRRLARCLEDSIKTIIGEMEGNEVEVAATTTKDDVLKAIENQLPNLSALVRRYLEELALELEALNPSAKGQTDDEWYEAFYVALDQTLDLVVDFAEVARTLSEWGAFQAIETLYGAFSSIFDRYEKSVGSPPYTNVDND